MRLVCLFHRATFGPLLIIPEKINECRKKHTITAFLKAMKGFYPRLQINITFGAIKQASTKMGTKKNTAEKKRRSKHSHTHTHTDRRTKALRVHSLCLPRSQICIWVSTKPHQPAITTPFEKLAKHLDWVVVPASTGTF